MNTFKKISVDDNLVNFLEDEVLPDLSYSARELLEGFSDIVEEFSPQLDSALAKRDAFQSRLDNWHKENSAEDFQSYKSFLIEIGYLEEEGEDFIINPQNVDPEISTIAGPQLVVPVMNARFALNAANARWGSLFDALYGTDMISEDDGAEKSGSYNPIRGNKVIAFAKHFLDQYFPLSKGSHAEVTKYFVKNHKLVMEFKTELFELVNLKQFVGYTGSIDSPSSILLRNNNLHVEILIDPNHVIGADDPAHVKDILLESAITTIQDCEDSVAAVDVFDKIAVYRNWLGLMKGNLSESFHKAGKELTRTLAEDKIFSNPNGDSFTLSGRSLMLVRNVGHLMTTNAVLLNGNEISEGLMDAFFTVLIAVHDLNKLGRFQNSRTGSVYIVKPKMHGPDEVSLTCNIFSAVERLLGLEIGTVKIGIMDEERRTSLNLKESIRRAKERVIFINTGFLDRTGDEIHTSMQAGPMIPKQEMKASRWIQAYEDRNVDIGLKCGFSGRAQIGKGMWPKPDELQEMYQTKIGHPSAGANCAWVPSPTAATLHAMHYHEIDVLKHQQTLKQRNTASLDDVLTIPLLRHEIADNLIRSELENNAQGILGYVVRWIDQGVGCSKVPDINNVGLMEDRATCRISSQHITNWLKHGIVSKDQVMETMKKMAVIVDAQNAGDPGYQNMSPGFTGFAFQAACDLVFNGTEQPNGYTEPLLHSYRIQRKKFN
ncbi:MAG: malate synthase G [Gammaproteobacteria bacterium]